MEKTKNPDISAFCFLPAAFVSAFCFLPAAFVSAFCFLPAAFVSAFCFLPAAFVSAFCFLPAAFEIIVSQMAEQPVPPPPRSRFRTLATESSIPIEADDLIVLARRYSEQGMYDESIHLYEMAEKLKPGSVALGITLARVRDLKKQDEDSRYAAVRQEVSAERARDEIDATQYAGLAQYYMAKD